MVEDDRSYAATIAAHLAGNGFEAAAVPTGADLFKQMDTYRLSMLIISLTLPDEDGIVLVRKVRARSDIPILVLTSRDGMDDKLACFALGADDYVPKTVDPRELVARIGALLRRNDPRSRKDALLVGEITLDRSRRLARHRSGAKVNLTPAEFSLLWILAQADGRVISRDNLVDAVSVGDGPASYRAVDILVSRVRKKLDKGAILTEPHVGYKCGWPVTGV
ncbi:response regulator transcription factor [Magnetospira sp. QH-2]|uniref:response regulator transcription factor n=1 Tax=Magnetospira sp. (strain QH-2) TaxID=1288970 RepID=UPI0003E8166F|nr:response regulator transcription factor [Magnetospira sp. QH-2]CCQ75229.1 putative two component transcriptional regulator [Magnetospira sp. QH-2]